MSRFASIIDLEYHLPARALDNAELEKEFPALPADKIMEKTGIGCRYLSAEGECSSDLAVAAAEKLLKRTGAPDEVDALLFCTQTPDHFLPTTACLLQDRLGLSKSVAALDFNLGCSGFVYGLGLAKGMIETSQASRVLLITADTYSKLIDEDDRSVRTLFGDAASATLVGAEDGEAERIGPFVYGSDGSGGEHLMVKTGGFREPEGKPTLSMNGPAIFTFTLGAVPRCVNSLLEKAGIPLDEIDLFVFHQANGFMLEHLRSKIGIPEEKFFVYLENCGNTVSASIPMTLQAAVEAGTLKRGMTVMLVGFGVGLSWAATLVRW